MLYLLFLGCSDVETKAHDHDHHEHEVITTVELQLLDSAGVETTVRWSDVEQSGTPEIDPIVMTFTEDASYTVALSFLNELENPAEDITQEIEDEGDVHQVFFVGTAIEDGLISHEYLDSDENSLPVGLSNQLNVLSVGEGELTIALRHMPQESGADIKVEGLAEEAESNGFSNIGGENDVLVTFPLTVE